MLGTRQQLSKASQDCAPSSESVSGTSASEASMVVDSAGPKNLFMARQVGFITMSKVSLLDSLILFA